MLASLPRQPASNSSSNPFLRGQDADVFLGKEAWNHRKNPQSEQSPLWLCHSQPVSAALYPTRPASPSLLACLASMFKKEQKTKKSKLQINIIHLIYNFWKQKISFLLQSKPYSWQRLSIGEGTQIRKSRPLEAVNTVCHQSTHILSEVDGGEGPTFTWTDKLWHLL